MAETRDVEHASHDPTAGTSDKNKTKPDLDGGKLMAASDALLCLPYVVERFLHVKPGFEAVVD